MRFVFVLALLMACSQAAAPRLLRETRQLAPRSYERPARREHPFELVQRLESDALHVRIVLGPCVTTTETVTRIQDVTLFGARRVEGDHEESVARVDSPPHACSQGPEGIEVRLLLPTGMQLLAHADARGEATLPLPASVLGELSRSAHAVLSVAQQAADLPLDPVLRDFNRRLRAEFGEIMVSDVVASSGKLSLDELLLEVAVSPRNGKNQFAGVFLPESAFSFERVELVPLDGGAAVPVSVGVDWVEVARADSNNVALVLDSSGSMRENDPRREGRIRAGEAVVRELVHSGSVAVLDFGVGRSQGLREARLLQDFTRDSRTLSGALHQLGEAGGTNLYASLEDALALLAQRGEGGSIVALTDGEAHDARLHRDVIERARRQGVTLFAVGLGDELDFVDLRQLGLATGGGFAEARDAGKLPAAFRGVGIGLAHGHVRVFGRGRIAQAPAPGGYRLRGTLVTRDPDSKRVMHDVFDTFAQLDSRPNAGSQVTLAAGGCNPDCYYDAACNVLSTGGGACCKPVENSLHGPTFAAQCRSRE